ncbi:MAG TPA: glycosyltransferase family 39 protein [Polyangiaceae bacterium]|nr:glycosyltransferase family 39 protein [Polyangiaceae bacterium]
MPPRRDPPPVDGKPANSGIFMRDACWLAGFALLLRVLVVCWAKDRFPPADDGTFYHAVAQRIAHGEGYTWRWPDGAVTYAAHYPVGYPALLGLAYAVFGARPVVAMLVNAVLGALSVFAAQRTVIRFGSRWRALSAALLVALHPGLLLYTPALMTEGVAAELLVVATWLCLLSAARPGFGRWLVALGVCLGALCLVRPQLLLMAPIFGFFALESGAPCFGARFARAMLVTGIALAVCLPWTLRNCARMDRCVFVSANGGWNLLIGSAPEANGAWIPIEGASVPPSCRNVFGEADKDRCFGEAGLANIRRDPLTFLRLIPRKLSVTFDYFGAPGHYLHTSNYRAFDESKKVWLGVVETGWERLVLLLAILQAAIAVPAGRVRGKLRWLVALPAAVFSVHRAGYLGYLGFVATVALQGKELLKRPASVTALAASLVLSTAATHAIFFGAGRYGFVCAALLCLACVGTGGGGGAGNSGNCPSASCTGEGEPRK